jgi:hypothetical protein
MQELYRKGSSESILTSTECYGDVSTAIRVVCAKLNIFLLTYCGIINSVKTKGLPHTDTVCPALGLWLEAEREVRTQHGLARP